MVDARYWKFAIAASVAVLATPAMASDFSGLIYIAFGAAVVVGAVALGIVMAIRSIARSGGPAVDTICAVLLGVVIAPSGFVEGFQGPVFTWLPIWIAIVFEENWQGAYILSPIVSLLLTCGVLFLMFRSLRLRNSEDRPEGGE